MRAKYNHQIQIQNLSFLLFLHPLLTHLHLGQTERADRDRDIPRLVDALREVAIQPASGQATAVHHDRVAIEVIKPTAHNLGANIGLKDQLGVPPFGRHEVFPENLIGRFLLLEHPKSVPETLCIALRRKIT